MQTDDEKTLKEILNDDLVKIIQNNKAHIVFFLIFIFASQYFHNQFIEKVINIFILPKATSSLFLDLIIFLIIDISLFIQIKWLINQFRPSLTQYLFFFGIWYLYFSFRFSLIEVHLDSPKIFGSNHLFGYIDYLILSTIPFAVIVLIRIIKFFRKDPTPKKNFFIEDLPLEKSNEDKIGFSIIIDELHKYLINDYYKKSFTVGVIAPWGHGKSSFLELFKNRVKQDHNNAIQIDFYPFLNHNSKDIIVEYFKTISNELNKYDGRLSGQLIDYAQNLAQAYKNYSIVNLFESKHSNQALTKQYLEIDAIITEINKPILVYIDDLDRLSGEEILTIFKIIRNSANFANTVFLLGIDINHIRQELVNLKISDPNKYLKKFFQLEVNLPLISKDVLKEYFVEIVLDQLNIDKRNNFENQLRNVLQNKNCLFDEYIENFRDLKRIINQYIFQKQLLHDQIDDKDLINYLMLISNYPSFLSIIQYERDHYFQHKGDLLILKKSNSVAIKKEDAHEYASWNPEKKFIPENFEVSKDLEKDNKTGISQDLRFYKSLYTIFGNEEDATEFSLRRIYNLNLILEYNYSANYLTNQLFEELKTLSVFTDLLEKLKMIDENGQLKQFIDRLHYDKLENIESFKFVLNSFIISYCILESNSLNRSQFYHPLSQFLNSKLKSNFDEKSVDYILHLIKNNEAINLKWKLNIFHFLDASIRENEIYLNFSLNKDAIELFEIMLSKINRSNYDYELFDYYHGLKDEDGGIIKETLNLKIHDFLKNKINLIRYCELIIDSNDIFTMFKISDIVVEMFDGKVEFCRFVRRNLDEIEEHNTELINFLNLLEATSFKQYIAYNFKSFHPQKRAFNMHTRRLKSQLNAFSGYQQVIIKIPGKYINEFYNASIDPKIRENNLKAELFNNEDQIVLSVSGIPRDQNEITDIIKAISLDKLDPKLVEEKMIASSNIFEVLNIQINHKYLYKLDSH